MLSRLRFRGFLSIFIFPPLQQFFHPFSNFAIKDFGSSIHDELLVANLLLDASHIVCTKIDSIIADLGNGIIMIEAQIP